MYESNFEIDGYERAMMSAGDAIYRRIKARGMSVDWTVDEYEYEGNKQLGATCTLYAANGDFLDNVFFLLINGNEVYVEPEELCTQVQDAVDGILESLT